MRLDTIYCKEPEDQIFHEPEQQQDCDIVINGIFSVKDIFWVVGRETVVSKENSTWLEPNTVQNRLRSAMRKLKQKILNHKS